MQSKYTLEILSQTVKESTTWAEVCRRLKIKPMTGSQTYIKNRANKLKIDSSHFVGKSFNKGRKFLQKRRPIEYYLVLDGPFINSHNLKNKLFENNLKEKKCETCGEKDWLGEEIPFELDHNNGNSKDNRIENLKIRCPNCHSVKTRKDRKEKARLSKMGRRA